MDYIFLVVDRPAYNARNCCRLLASSLRSMTAWRVAEEETERAWIFNIIELVNQLPLGLSSFSCCERPAPPFTLILQSFQQELMGCVNDDLLRHKKKAWECLVTFIFI